MLLILEITKTHLEHTVGLLYELGSCTFVCLTYSMKAKSK
jgi:hypothetical protein